MTVSSNAIIAAVPSERQISELVPPDLDRNYEGNATYAMISTAKPLSPAMSPKEGAPNRQRR